MTTPRLGFGPVFANEWLTTSRRWQSYAGRAVFVGVLLLGLTSVWVARVDQAMPPLQAMAEIGRSFYNTIVFTQLTLVFLAAPAATAGVICQDKASGTLGQMLLTDLTDAEIVLGKLAARLVPVIGLVCCALPALSLATLLGGVDPEALTGVFLTTLGVAIFGCALSLALSVWGTKPYEVLLATYGILGVWLLTGPVVDVLRRLWRYPPLPEWVHATNPYELALATYARPGRFGLMHSVAMAVTLVLISCTLAALAIAQVRGVAVRQADPPSPRQGLSGSLARWFGARGQRFDRGSSLDDNPVLWYEVHRQRPSLWTMTLIRLYFVAAIGFTILAVDHAIRGFSVLPGLLATYVVAFQVALSLPILIVAATTALVEERARGSLDILLTTPIASRTIVLTKWWSVYRKLPLVLVLPALIAAVLAWQSGGWIIAGVLVLFIAASAAFWTSVGLAISTWVPRLGRAISLAVALYAIAGLGWPILASVVLPSNWPEAVGLALISPYHAIFDLTRGIFNPGYLESPGFAWYPGWIIAQAILALLLLLATLATFDRSIGRMRVRRSAGRRVFDAIIPSLPARSRA